MGGRIPKQYIPSVEKGFRNSVAKGPLAKYPVVGVRVHLEDGSYHEVDSSDKAFMTAAQGCFRTHFKQTRPVILEPIMTVEIAAIPLANNSPSSAPSMAQIFSTQASELTLDNRE